LATAAEPDQVVVELQGARADKLQDYSKVVQVELVAVAEVQAQVVAAVKPAIFYP
jgi:hypothetical protein